MNNPVVLDPKTELNEQTAQDVRLQLRQDADVQRIYNAVDIKDQLELIELGNEIHLLQFDSKIVIKQHQNELTLHSSHY